MNQTKEFVPIVLTNRQDLEAKKKDAKIVLDYFERARKQFLEVFGIFDIEYFNMIYTHRKPHLLYKELVAKYIEVKGIDLRGIKLDKALQINLLDLPDIGKLLESINDLKRHISSFGVNAYISFKDIRDIYSEEAKQFLSPYEPESIVGQKIEEAYKLETETDEENEYLKQVADFAEMFVKFLSEHQTISLSDGVPGKMFKITEATKGNFGYSINQTALRTFRAQKNATKKKFTGFNF